MKTGSDLDFLLWLLHVGLAVAQLLKPKKGGVEIFIANFELRFRRRQLFGLRRMLVACRESPCRISHRNHTRTGILSKSENGIVDWLWWTIVIVILRCLMKV